MIIIGIVIAVTISIFFAYEQDPTTGEKAKLILHHPRIKRQRKLSEQDMHEYIQESEKLTNVTRKILSMIGKSKNLRL